MKLFIFVIHSMLLFLFVNNLLVDSGLNQPAATQNDPNDKSPRTPPPEAQPVEIIVKKTEVNDYGNGATIFLDRHHVNCEQGALNGFRFTKKGANNFFYTYKCAFPEECDNKCKAEIDIIDEKACKEFKTPDGKIGNEIGNAIIDLRAHSLKCPPNMVMKGFRFERNSPKIRYSYTCCRANVKSCTTTNTPQVPYGDFSTKYLAGLKVDLKKDQVLTGFHLKFDLQKKNMWYKLEVCIITG